MEKECRRIENISELVEVKPKTVVEIPRMFNKSIKGVFIERTRNEVLLLTRSDSNPEYVSENYCDTDLDGNFSCAGIPQGTDFRYLTKSWSGRRINRILRRNGL